MGCATFAGQPDDITVKSMTQANHLFPPFLRNKLNFSVTLAVFVTTVFSKYNLNSWCILLLVFLRLADGGPVRAIKAAFSDKYFLAYLALFLLDAVGMAYTHHPSMGGHIIEKSGTLVAISFVLCGGKFADDDSYKQFMTACCLSLFVACAYCLGAAGYRYTQDHDYTDFFYHALSKPIGVNAVFFTVYMIFGLLYLLSHPLQTGRLSRRIRKMLQTGMIAVFTMIIVLLSSKLLLIILILIMSSVVLRRFIERRNYIAIGLVGCIGLGGLLWLTLTDNPIKRRYQDLERGDLALIKANKFTPSTEFNGAQLRLLQWRYAGQILRENHAWLFGVSAGDAQERLNEKYKKAEVDTGIPNTRQKGFLDYNFHNQYIETTVRSGLVGLAVLLMVCGLLILIVYRQRSPESFFMILTLLLIMAVESFLTLQHGIFAFTFMPLILRYSPGRRKSAR
jgi:O-antigen ligase